MFIYLFFINLVVNLKQKCLGNFLMGLFPTKILKRPQRASLHQSFESIQKEINEILASFYAESVFLIKPFIKDSLANNLETIHL